MNDTDYIRRTLELARRGTALASPGPMVGAVIVKDDAIVGEGFYTWDGVHHAEVHALRQAGDAARGCDRLHLARALRPYRAYAALRPGSHRRRRGARRQCHSRIPIRRVNGQRLRDAA